MYRDEIEYLYGLQRFGIKFGLENIRMLLEALGWPQERLRVVHIAGTNGKGSTAAFIESILLRGGYRVGLYTSPHLIRFTERIRLNGKEIDEKRVVDLTRFIRSRVGTIPITFFEFVTAMAVVYFVEEGTEIAILEAGMGGRLDATNACPSLLSIITNISLEHRAYLGKTLMAIAGEKVGIVKEGGTVISGALQKGVRRLIERRCQEKGATLYQYRKDFTVRVRGFDSFDYRGIQGRRYRGLKSSLKGRHQGGNLALSLAAIEVLRDRGWRISDPDIVKGVEQAQWRGRLEVVEGRSKILLDGAHNPAAIRILRRAIERDFVYRSLWILMGVMGDKDYRAMVRILRPLAHSMTFCRPRMDRSLDPAVLAALVGTPGPEVRIIEDVGEALKDLMARAHERDLILVTGSLFVVGEALAVLDEMRKNPFFFPIQGSL